MTQPNFTTEQELAAYNQLIDLYHLDNWTGERDSILANTTESVISAYNQYVDTHVAWLAAQTPE